MRDLGPSEKVLFVQKSFWKPSKARYLVTKIKPYKKVSANKRGSKDLVFYGEGWENYDKDGLTFLSN